MMDYLAAKEEFNQLKADFNQRVEVELRLPPPCFELSFADAGEAMAAIARMVNEHLILPDTMQPRSGQCGAWHAGSRVKRNEKV